MADYLEEGWHSMDLVAEQIAAAFQRLAPGVHAELIRPVFRPRLTRNLDRLVNRFIDYPRQLQRGAFDVFHIADHSYSQLALHLPPGRTVITCHDLDTFRCLIEPTRDPRPAWFRLMVKRILRGFQSAAHVFTVTAAVRDEIIRFSLIDAARVSVLSNGIDDAFLEPAGPTPLPWLDGATRPWILHVGSTIPRKRMDVLLAAFETIRRAIPSATLIRVGGPFTDEQSRLAEERGINGSIRILPRLTRDQVAEAYRQSDIVMLPSDSEGFGLPLLEALSSGRPVVASDIAVLREVGGVHPVYCPPGDPQAFANAALARLSMPAAADARDAAIRHARSFSWDAYAVEALRVYRAIIARTP